MYNFDNLDEILAAIQASQQDTAKAYNEAGRPAGNVQNPVAKPYNPQGDRLNYLKNLNPNVSQNTYNPFSSHGLNMGIHQTTRDQGRQVLGQDYSDKNYDNLMQKGFNKNPFNQAAQNNGISLQQSQANALRNSNSSNNTGGMTNG